MSEVTTQNVVETPIQSAVLRVLCSIHAAAVEYRATGVAPSPLAVGSGICWNIDQFTNGDAVLREQTAQVKENLIRATPSYSGEYHYPVKCPRGGKAEVAFDKNEDKWAGDYGLLRLTQLEELIACVRENWNDDLAKRSLSPARRTGWKIGDFGRHRETGAILVLKYDDDTQSPGFGTAGNTDYSWIDISKIERIKIDPSSTKSVSALVEEADGILAQQRTIQSQLNELTKQLTSLAGDMRLVDFQLAHVHKVRRLANS